MEKVLVVAISQVVTRLVNSWESSQQQQRHMVLLPLSNQDITPTGSAPPSSPKWVPPLQEVIVHAAPNGAAR